MATKKRLSPEERREQILECAKRVFAERGLTGAKTKDIANACGINEAVLYDHFRSKEELFRESATRLYRELKDAWQKEADKSPTGLEALHAVVRAEISLLHDNPQICANLLHAVASSTLDEGMREISVAWFNQHNEMMIDLIRRGIADASLRPETIPERATMFIRGMIWMCLLRIVLGLGGDASELARQVSESLNTRLAALPFVCRCPGVPKQELTPDEKD